jgi:tetratricopeptide (TPR) repeat protein
MESVGDDAKAAVYHQERVASSPHSATAWYDYACFLMRTNDAPLAEECTREAIALSPASAECLLAHGTVLASRGNLEQAEVFLKAALEQQPQATDGWLTMALLYDLMGRTADMKTSTKQARLLHGQDSLEGCYLALANKLLPLNCAVLIERALGMEESLAGGTSGALLLCRGEMLLCKPGGLDDAAGTLEAGLELARKSASGFALLGRARLRLGQPEAARAAFEKALDFSPQPYPLSALLLLGQLCLDAADDARAKEVFLYACRQAPSCTSWLGAGVACRRLGEMGQAEEALAEANVLNNRHPVVWGQVAMLALQKQRYDEAEQALGQAYKLGLMLSPLLIELSAALHACGKWAEAEDAARKAMLAQEAAGGVQAPAYRALADALLEQQRYDESLSAFKSALAAGAAPDVAKHCKAQASHILHFHLNRPHEAAGL